MDQQALDLVYMDQEIIKQGGLRSFMQLAWPEVESVPFVDGWHIGVVADHLEAVSRGELRNLIINIPPGCMKSLSVCVMWPSWEWAEVNPWLRYIYASYGADLSRRDAIRMRNLVDGDWYQARWDVNIPYQNTRSATMFENNKGGFRFSTSVQGGVTGKHAHRLVVDDPIKPQETMGTRAALGTALDNAIAWYDGTLSTRQSDPKTTARVLIMQRLHSKDLAGYLEDQKDRGYTVLRLPMEYEAKHHCSTEWGEDQRSEDKELLWPERYPRFEVNYLKTTLGPGQTASQLQQRPNPAGGKVFKEEHIQYWGHAASEFPELPRNCSFIQAWDMTFKGAEGATRKRSYTAGHVWGRSGANVFLVDREHGRWEFIEACHALLRLTKRNPKAIRKYVEDAANGPAVVSALKNKVQGLKLVPTGGGSEARANAVSPMFEAGNVWFPHPSIAPWVSEVVDELIAFPNGANDDDVDACTHALVKLGVASAASAYKAAMENMNG